MVTALVDIDDLCDAGSAAAAAALVKERFADAPRGTRIDFQRAVASRLALYPEALEKDIAAGGAAVGLARPKVGWPPVVLADARGGSCARRFEDGHLAVVDASFLSDAALFVFFATRRQPYAMVAAAAIFALSVLRRGRVIPYDAELVTLAFLLDPAVMREIVDEVADMVALHEVGHAYVEASGRDFVAMDVVSAIGEAELESALAAGQVPEAFSVHAGAWSHWHAFRNRATGRARLVLPSRDAHEIEEYAPDVFAVLARSVLDAQGPPRGDALPVWEGRYLVWALVALLLEAIEEEAEGGAWLRGIRTVRDLDVGRAATRTHPRAATRNDVVLFHLRELFDATDMERRSEDAPTWSVLRKVHRAVWSRDLMLHQELLVQNVRLGDVPEESRIWLEAFETHVKPTPWRYPELTPMARYMSARLLGELRGLAVFGTRSGMPHADLLRLESEIGDRVVRDAASVKGLRTFARLIAGIGGCYVA